MPMSTPKKYYFYAANTVGFHISVSQTESKEASLVGDVAVQNKIL